MKIEFWAIGKTAFPYITEGMNIYEKRLIHYNPYETVLIPDVKDGAKLPPDLLKQREGEAFLAKLQPQDFLILLDENGVQPNSVALAQKLSGWLQGGHRKLVFVVGGAYGFSEAMYRRANFKLSLSAMTFSHQMIRLFVVEQLYRAMTILRGESYHNA
jgi:23S rRNA (pseudouridine1915-N3)-methyltransferase